MIHFAGVYAALLTPRHPDGTLDIESYRQQLTTLSKDELVGYAINGATGEFTLNSEPELELLLAEARRTTPSAEILCGIGAGDVYGTVRRGRLAAAAGAKAALLPMPSFFPYRQDDMRSFVLEVASKVELPILLYNLPQFTTGLEVETVLSLLEHDNIVGIKDSSGSLDIMRAITDAGLPAARMIGNDSVLCEALAEGLCDGVVSGVACALPELMTALFATGGKGPSFLDSKKLLHEFIEQLHILPTPWGLKVTSAARGFTRESYPFPLSPNRSSEAAQLRTWFTDWYKWTLSSKTGAA
jgi:4-hydroxy-tetrahydrodipicolinate synthase